MDMFFRYLGRNINEDRPLDNGGIVYRIRNANVTYEKLYH